MAPGQRLANVGSLIPKGPDGWILAFAGRAVPVVASHGSALDGVRSHILWEGELFSVGPCGAVLILTCTVAPEQVSLWTSSAGLHDGGPGPHTSPRWLFYNA